MKSAEDPHGMPTVTVTATDRCIGPKATDAMEDSEKPDAEASANATDWQTVVKQMLSIQLPSKPITTRVPPKVTPFGETHSLSHRTLASYAMTSAEQEALGSGSPKASRSPLATTPRSNSGLLLVRIDESAALDTSSDCGDVCQDPNDPTLDPDYFRQAAPREQQRTRSRLAHDSGRSSRVSSAGEEALAPEEKEREPELIDPSTMVKINNLSVKTSVASADSESYAPKLERTLSAQPSGMRSFDPAGVSTTAATSKSSLAKYKPDAAAIAGLKFAAMGRSGGSNAPTGRKMRRSIVARMSEHGGESEDEGERVDFAEQRLTLDGLKRNAETKLQLK